MGRGTTGIGYRRAELCRGTSGSLNVFITVLVPCPRGRPDIRDCSKTRPVLDEVAGPVKGL
jgi:hypothetical protein